MKIVVESKNAMHPERRLFTTSFFKEIQEYKVQILELEPYKALFTVKASDVAGILACTSNDFAVYTWREYRKLKKKRV